MPTRIDNVRRGSLDTLSGEGYSAHSSNIKGGIDRFSHTRLSGWVADLDNPDQVLTIQIKLDGEVLAESPASQPREDLGYFLSSKIKHGFDFTFAPLNIKDYRSVRFVLKGSEHEISLPDNWSPVAIWVESKTASYVTGWAWNAFDPDSHVRLRFFHGARELGHSIANIQRPDLAASGIGSGDHAFQFQIPSGHNINPDLISVDFDPIISLPLTQETKVGSIVTEEQSVNPVVIAKEEKQNPGLIDDARRAADADVARAQDNTKKKAENPPTRPASGRQVDWRGLAYRYFNEQWYVEQQAASISHGQNPFEHWWSRGRHAGLSPHPLFDADFYGSQINNKNIEKRDLFLHFLHNGHKQPEDPHPCFSMNWYRLRYPSRESDHPWIDYLDNGRLSKRDPNWLFSNRFIAPFIQNDLRQEQTFLEAYLARFGNSQVSPHSLLDIPLVLRHHNDIKGDAPYLNFWRAYRAREIRTHLYFDPRYYAAQLDERPPNIRALADYILVGEPDGLKPIPLMEPKWYAGHYGVDSNFTSILEEYVSVGERLYRHPCPGFDPRFYLEMNNDVTRAGASPLRHFITAGQKEKRQAHRRFDLEWYSRKVPEEHTERALEYWIEVGCKAGELMHPALSGEGDAISPDALRNFLAPRPSREDVILGITLPLIYAGDADIDLTPPLMGQAWLLDHFDKQKKSLGLGRTRQLKLNEPIARQYDRFDYDAARDFADSVNSRFSASGMVLPLVSIIVPTRNRVSVLRRAIHSVLKQTYSRFELIIVDDGGLDSTDKLIFKHFSDPRIVYVPINAAGVSGARNAGLCRSRGDYIAYLDSDNYWEPNCLEIVIKAMLLSGVFTGYSVLRAFNDKGVVKYRGDEFHFPSLKRENYIDMNVYVHHRHIFDSGITFDESLKRCVDWDYILRASELSQPLFVPIIGCNYVDDSGALERITTNELSGDFYKICQRGIDLRPHITGVAPDGDCRASIIWPISNPDWSNIEDDLWSMVKFVMNGPDELVIINNNLNHVATSALYSLSLMSKKVRVIHLWRTFHLYPAFNLASGIARGAKALLWRSDTIFDSETVDSFIDFATARSESVVLPVTLAAGGKVSSEFASMESSSHILEPFLTGQVDCPLYGNAWGVIPVNSTAILDIQMFRTFGGFSAPYAVHYALAELCMRLAADDPENIVLNFSTRLTSRHAMSSTISDGEFQKELGSLKESWLGCDSIKIKLPADTQIKSPLGAKPVNRNWVLCPDVTKGRRLSTPNISRSLSFAIRCPAPDAPERVLWGDFHYAQAMKAALEEFGHVGVIELRDTWNSDYSAGDIVLHIRGIVDVKPVQNKINLMWVISHPDKIDLNEYNAMDAIFGAGPGIITQLKQMYGISAHLLLQGTDHTRFCGDIDRVAGIDNKALFVGNSRLQLRPIVLDSLEAGLPLVIYGSDWDTILPSHLVQGKYLRNEELANWYGSAGVVLNDHWPSMSEYGIISNRIFDVVATGRPVITDYVGGLGPIFGGAVRTYQDASSLKSLFDHLCDGEYTDIAKYIRSNHSIKNRVEELLVFLGIRKRRVDQ